jgi:tetratricopeptide (TPR) repeat protein
VTRTRTTVLAIALALAGSLVPSSALAGDTRAALAKARAAFEESDYDAAADAYQLAIDGGKLAPNELAEAFVRVGVAFASQGKSKKALDAFRLAVIVDASVAFPPTGPKKAKPLLEQARKEMAKRTGDWLRVTFPERASSIGGTVASVRVRLEAVAGLEALEVEARSGEGEPWVQRMPLVAETQLVLPRALHATGRVRVRIAAVDDVGNRWGEVERSLDVERLPAPEPPPVARTEDPAPKKKRREASEPARPSATATESKATRASDGFWSTPWPWVALGTVVVGFGGAYAFTLVDASSPARVGPPTVTGGP